MAAKALDGVGFSEEKEEYIIKVLDPVFAEMVKSVLMEMPDRPIDFMISWLSERRTSTRRQGSAPLQRDSTISNGSCASSRPRDSNVAFDLADSDDSQVFDDLLPVMARAGPRAAVSAEADGFSSANLDDFEPPVYSKSSKQQEECKRILMKSFLFKSLSKEFLDVMVMALKKETFDDREVIIREGDWGEHLFIIEKGSAICKKTIDGVERITRACQSGDVFGELALLHNCPRAATVEAVQRCRCWQLDRRTFHHISRKAALHKLAHYDAITQQVPLFSNLNKDERAQLIDILHVETFRHGEYIMKQGDAADKFYILEEGQVTATKSSPGKPETTVRVYNVGEFFGELALVNQKPRSANIFVTGDVAKVLSVDKDAFGNMFGPLDKITKRPSRHHD